MFNYDLKSWYCNMLFPDPCSGNMFLESQIKVKVRLHFWKFGLITALSAGIYMAPFTKWSADLVPFRSLDVMVTDRIHSITNDCLPFNCHFKADMFIVNYSFHAHILSRDDKIISNIKQIKKVCKSDVC